MPGPAQQSTPTASRLPSPTAAVPCFPSEGTPCVPPPPPPLPLRENSPPDAAAPGVRYHATASPRGGGGTP